MGRNGVRQIRTQHFPPPGPQRKLGIERRQAVQRVILRSEFERDALLDAIKKWRIPPLDVPHDGVVRAVASEAKVPERTDRVPRFAKCARTFCELALGYQDRYVVGEYLYLKLKQLIGKRKRRARARIVYHLTHHSRDPVKLLEYVEREISPVSRANVEAMAMQVFREIEAEILAIADFGSEVDWDSPKGYRAVQGLASFVANAGCFLILKDRKRDKHRKPQDPLVLALQSARDFNRARRKRFNRRARAQRFSQRPAGLRP